MEVYDSLIDKKSHFNQDSWRVINTTRELDDVIEEFKSLKQATTHTVFRGVCESKYKLYTSLQRDCFEKNIDLTQNTPTQIIKRLIEEGRKNPRGYNILPSYFKTMGIPLNDWMLLAILQHYGAPSPLLDFTKDFIPALYFMCLGMNHKYSKQPIDHYGSIVFFKAVDACAHVIENIRKTGYTIYQNSGKTLESYKDRNNFVLDDLSFENVIKDKELELIPSYKGVTNITHEGNHRFIVNLPISNMNMASQEGEFVCNISPDKPIEDLMVKEDERYLHCINIHKKLYHYIIDTYLKNSLEETRKKLFPSEYQAAQDIYSRTMTSLF